MEICYVRSLFWSITGILFFFFYFTPFLVSTLPLSNRAHPHFTNASDQEALIGFLSAITYDPTLSLSATWKLNVSFCDWTRVICSRRRQRVVSLNVSGMGLQDSKDLALTSTHALKGSIGYIPPEYGLGGCVTTKGDVYSYGVVLLEMLTRKKPTHNMFVEGMNLQKWVGSGFPNQVREVVDKSLLRRTSAVIEEDKELNCLNHLVNVGLLCTKESPEGRPTMINIVGILQNIRDTFFTVAGIPKFQSNITHLLGSTSVVHNNVGEGQSSSTF